MSGYFLRAKEYKLQQTGKEKAEAASRSVSPSNQEFGGRFDQVKVLKVHKGGSKLGIFQFSAHFSFLVFVSASITSSEQESST